MEHNWSIPSEQVVNRLVGDMESTGYACLPDWIPAAPLAMMRSFVSSAIARSSGEYVGFTSAEAVAGSNLDVLGASHGFQSLMKQIYESGTGRSAPPVQFHQVLRCLTGRSIEGHSLRFHYDSYVVTALVPIEIPTGGRTGDLIMLPNTRRVRRFYATNLLDKVLLDNALSQMLLRTLLRIRLLPVVRVKLIPGHVYFFWGYRSIHTNEACDPDSVRATALFHFANPHANTGLRAKLRPRPT